MTLKDVLKEVERCEVSCPYCSHRFGTSDLHFDQGRKGKKWKLGPIKHPQQVYFKCTKCKRVSEVPKEMEDFLDNDGVRSSTRAVLARLQMEVRTHPRIPGWLEIQPVPPGFVE